MGLFDWFNKKKADKVKKGDFSNETIETKDIEEQKSEPEQAKDLKHIEPVTEQKQTEPESIIEQRQLEPEPITEQNQIETEPIAIQEQIELKKTKGLEENKSPKNNLKEEQYETSEQVKDNSIEDNLNNNLEDNLIEDNLIINETKNDVSEIPTKKSFFSKLLSGLDKTRKNIIGSVDQVLKAFTKVDEELFEELEEALIMADIGIPTTEKIIDSLRQKIKSERITDVSEVKNVLVEVISEILEKSHTDKFEFKSPAVILIIGVNGVGKTTTIGKIANNLKKERKKVLIAAADTFRAAAIDQLEIWGKRAGIDVIKHKENSDPAAVVYDAILSAKAKKTDVLICDTAGRLHNKKNLMEELKKIFKIISRDFPEAQKEVFLVLDATTGQNALQQAKLFSEVADITGIVLTKLDGTAKGGIVISISNELKIPVRYIGVGESINDLQTFVPKDFAKALFQIES